VEHDQIETNNLVQSNSKGVESGLQALWESARRAGEELNRLRQERGILHTRLVQLEKEVSDLRQELRRVREEQAKVEDTKRGIHFNGDRQVLSAKVKELLTRIDSYL
jgi:predicted nuclease with TOPRIM domain